MSSTERNSLVTCLVFVLLTIFFGWATHHAADTRATGLAALFTFCCAGVTCYLFMQHGAIKEMWRRH